MEEHECDHSNCEAREKDLEEELDTAQREAKDYYDALGDVKDAIKKFV